MHTKYLTTPQWWCSLVMFAIVPAAQASSIDVLSTPAFLEPSTSGPNDKDGCPPVASNADPEEGSLQAMIVVTAPIADPNVLIEDDNASGSESTTVDDLTIDDATTGTPDAAGVVRDLDYLDGVLDGMLAADTYFVYFNLDKTGYTQGPTINDSLNCAGNSVANDQDTYTATLRSGTTAVDDDSMTTLMVGSAGIKQNDLDWLETFPTALSPSVGDSFCVRSKYRQSSAKGLYQLIGMAYYNAEIVRLDSVDLYYYDTNGADPGSIEFGIPGAGEPGVVPEDAFEDKVNFDAADLAALGSGSKDLSSGDHWVSEFCFTLIDTGSTYFSPYWQTQASSTSNWKVDSGFGQVISISYAALSIEKECDGTPDPAAEVGGEPTGAILLGVESELTHSLRVCNEGDGDAVDVEVIDTLPYDPLDLVQDVQFVDATSPDPTLADGAFDPVNREITWAVGDLAAGVCVDLPFTVAVTSDGDPNPVFTNDGASATGFSAENLDVMTSGDTGETCPIDVLEPELQIVKSISDPDGIFSPGETVHYEIEVCNTGNADAQNAVITDDYDETAFASIQAISSGGIDDGDVIEWDIGSVWVGACEVVTYEGVLHEAGYFPPDTCGGSDNPNDVTNLATVVHDSGSDSDDETVCVEAAPDLAAAKRELARQPTDYVDLLNSVTVSAVGGVVVDSNVVTSNVSSATEVTYEIEVCNNGDANADGVSIEDVIDSDAEFVSATGGGVESGGIVTWALGTLAPGGCDTVQLVVKTN